MKVIMVETGRTAQIVEIGKGLKSMQNAVGGNIEAIDPFEDEVALVCNEEGKFNGSRKNRVLLYKDLSPNLFNPNKAKIFDTIYGDFFICGAPTDSEEFESLSEEQIATYYRLFETPDYTYSDIEEKTFNESEKEEMKKFVVNCDYTENSDLAIRTARDIVEYLNNGEYTDLETAINEEVDRQTIYYDDQWELMKTYQRPENADYQQAVEMFITELYSIIAEEEIEEEIEEQGEER